MHHASMILDGKSHCVMSFRYHSNWFAYYYHLLMLPGTDISPTRSSPNCFISKHASIALSNKSNSANKGDLKFFLHDSHVPIPFTRVWCSPIFSWCCCGLVVVVVVVASSLSLSSAGAKNYANRWFQKIMIRFRIQPLPITIPWRVENSLRRLVPPGQNVRQIFIPQLILVE